MIFSSMNNEKFAPQDVQKNTTEPERITEEAISKKLDEASQKPVVVEPVKPTTTAAAPKKTNTPLWFSLYFIIFCIFTLLPICFVCGVLMLFAGIGSYASTVKTPTPSVFIPTISIALPTSSILKPQPTAVKSTPPAGFSWVNCGNINAQFLRPDGWFIKETTISGIPTCYITKETVDSNGNFSVGTTVSLYTSVTSKYQSTPSDYGKKLLTDISKGKTSSSITSITSGTYIIHGVTILLNKNSVSTQENILAITSSSRDRVYLLVFESSVKNWDDNWKKYGDTMFNDFGL